MPAGDHAVGAGLSSAEEVIDRRVTFEQFQGRELETTTGRVLLHALSADGQALCGRPAARLTATGQQWDAGYLPHVPRCGACVAVTLGGDRPVPGSDEPDVLDEGLPATGVDVRTVHGTDLEAAGANALREILARHDLRRWMFTDLVRVDAEIRGGFSHPLTISPRLLLRRPACALTTFLHEQLHWMDSPGHDGATTEASNRWPDPPPPPAGCRDAESTWLHMAVCALEYQSLSEIIGPVAAAAELRQQVHYSWVYGQILDDPAWFAGFLRRHGLQLPERPPVPRRYLGEDWWTKVV